MTDTALFLIFDAPLAAVFRITDKFYGDSMCIMGCAVSLVKKLVLNVGDIYSGSGY